MRLGKFFELIIGLSLILVVIFVTYKLFIEQKDQKQEASTPAISQSSSELEKEKKEAASKGVNWLIENKDTISLSDSAVQLIYLYKTTNDTKLAGSLSNLITEKIEKIPHVDTSFNVKDKKYLDWDNLKGVLYSIKKKKCDNKEYTKDLEVFKTFLTKNKNEIFSDKMNLSEKLIAAYQLTSFGIGLDNFYPSVLSEIRSKYAELYNPSAKNYYFNLYVLSHAVLIESGYFDRFLDSKAYSAEVNELNKSLDKFLSDDNLNDSSIDILSEILISFKLLKIAPDQKTNSLYRKLIGFQNKDGSWGKDSKNSSLKFHHTSVATLALIEFAPEFRRTTTYCFPK